MRLIHEPEGENSIPCVFNRIVYLGKEDGCLYTLNTGTGYWLWRYYMDLQRALPSARENKVCVFGSGDHLAAFGFHFLGAKMVSVDLSEQQLANARIITEATCVEMEFVCADVLDLSRIPGKNIIRSIPQTVF